MTNLASLKADLVAARKRGDQQTVRDILATLRRLARSEDALAPKTTETR